MKFLLVCLAMLAALPAAADQQGQASWYGGQHVGRPTASGEIFTRSLRTAAHKNLPLGCRVRVTNLLNHRSVLVRINDRGPFVKGRIIDLSEGAARDLQMIKTGVAEVRIEPLCRTAASL
jgi:rare lipoprotein A